MEIAKHISTAALEMEIIKGKLAQGVNGVEWIVLNLQRSRSEEIDYMNWLNGKMRNGRIYNLTQMMLDVLTTDSDGFYEAYGWNWQIILYNTLLYLRMLKDEKYDLYFDFMKRLSEVSVHEGA